MIANHIVVYVSYLPPRRLFTAHRDGLPGISASSLPELRARVAEACPEAKVVLSLSRAARAEMARAGRVPRCRSVGREGVTAPHGTSNFVQRPCSDLRSISATLDVLKRVCDSF